MTFEPDRGADSTLSRIGCRISTEGQVCRLTTEPYAPPPAQPGMTEGWARRASSLETGDAIRMGREATTTEPAWLTLLAELAVSLWLPYAIGAPRTLGPVPADLVRPARDGALESLSPPAPLNTTEALAPFAAVVLAPHAADVATVVTTAASVTFFQRRRPQAVGAIAGRARYARPAHLLCKLALHAGRGRLPTGA
ncbi:MAG: hypothetical protein V2I65_04385 [Paracoccaceae bacterium]|jgi:hypothetical protein|nr:hypothetical protein [Paracoccaceae bacterium]